MSEELVSERTRVLAFLSDHLELMDNNSLDDWARKILDLPPRPQGQKPFIGWLLPQMNSNDPSLDDKRLSLAGEKLIKQWEGYREKAYLCAANQWTIGWGHTKTARRGMTINREQAQKLFNQDIAEFERAVNRLVKVPITQGQFDALVSFSFNLGVYALGSSSLLRALNALDYSEAAEWFDRYVYANRTKLPGLVSRRQEEKKMFLS